ncbi:GNAT family N-acetyltransferase [Streptomyces sp. NPDC018031]|uniref:GNAT family N-acetyltransferase n=1 Tax=Streptomyces sp. NPDC018031 TaxID=3365033 RepID=UPI00379F36F2
MDRPAETLPFDGGELRRWRMSDPRRWTWRSPSRSTTCCRGCLGLPGIDRIEIRHDAANRASAAIPRRLGFTEVGRVRVSAQPLAPGEVGIDVTWRLPTGRGPDAG